MEVHVHGLGVSNVEVTVRLRREPGPDLLFWQWGGAQGMGYAGSDRVRDTANQAESDMAKGAWAQTPGEKQTISLLLCGSTPTAIPSRRAVVGMVPREASDGHRSRVFCSSEPQMYHRTAVLCKVPITPWTDIESANYSAAETAVTVSKMAMLDPSR